MADDPPGLDPLVDAVMGAMPAGLDRDAGRRAVRSSIEGVVGALDGLMDLGLAESVHQLAGANFARASAATDMIGRAAVPPDAFDVAATPRGGQGIDQRLVVAVGGDDRPAGYASDTPRAHLAPEADAFVARRLGPLDRRHACACSATTATEVGSCALADLGLAALDLAADAASTGTPSPFPLLLARARAVGRYAERRRSRSTPTATATSSTCSSTPPAGTRRWPAGGRCPPARFRPRGVDPAAGEPAAAGDDGGALAAVLARADVLEAAAHDALRVRGGSTRGSARQRRARWSPAASPRRARPATPSPRRRACSAGTRS